ncbi:MAG: sulfotransferase [Pseudomonadota bacterium]
MTDDGLPEAKQQLQSGDFMGALATARALRHEGDQTAEALYIEAVCLRYLHRLDDAAQTVEELITAMPRYARAYQERGHIFKAQGASEKAINAYAEATARNPSLLAAWRSLAELADPTSDGAALARKQIARLKAMPPVLVSVESMMHDGKFYQAEQLCRKHLQANPQDTTGMRLLAQLGMELGILDDAEFLLESALAFAPHDTEMRLDYISVLHKRQKYERSFEEVASLHRAHPDDPAITSSYANEALAVGRFDEAIDIYDDLAERFPQVAVNHLVRGHALKTVGRHNDAVNAYRSAYNARASFGDAYWSLANLKTYQFNDDELEQMRTIERSIDLSPEDHYHLCFALGKALEDRDSIDEAFAYYAQGNALKRQELRYDPDRMDEELKAQKDLFTEDFLRNLPQGGSSSPAPIFIVGLPRAGSTLVEQILASHTDVEGTLELPNILALVHKLNGRRKLGDDPRYPSVIKQLTPEQRTQFGEAFLKDTAVHRGNAPRFTDKMPNNFRHIGLIRMMLPQAKIIDARRNPFDCCFSGFKQLFAEGQEFSYSLSDLGRYYRGYVDLMAHWDHVFPGQILRLQYEDVVEDLEGSVRKLLAFCDLPFEDQCLRFFETDRSVRTASSEQVRRPLYSSGVGQWRPFATHLEPLFAALGPLAPERLHA